MNVEHVSQPAAVVLRAGPGSDGEETRVLWSALANAEVGARWSASASRALWSESEEAEVIAFEENEKAILRITRDYRCEGRESEHTARLLVCEFWRRIPAPQQSVSE